MNGLLKFITCGSVDDGKSTLIGHILYDAKLLYADQERALELDSKVGSRGGKIDYSLLLDGLMAEREQGITIDVAYRYFTTNRRSFIVADTPGHEEYTRNMAVGASFAELAVILVDAMQGVLAQTRRHARICALMGIRHFVFAVNKMDLAAYSEHRFAEIAAEIAKLSQELGLENVAAIPLSATEGDNVVHKSERLGWYAGEALLPYLETVDTGDAAAEEGFYLPVQRVCRPDHTFRGFQGQVEAGEIAVGGLLTALPSGEQAKVKQIFIGSRQAESASHGQPVTIQLDREVDVSRGCVLVQGTSPAVSNQFRVSLLWMDDEPLTAGKSFFVKIGTKRIPGAVSAIRYRVDVNTGAQEDASKLSKNEIAVCEISLDQPVVLDSFANHRTLGECILIDRVTNATSACGVVDEVQESRAAAHREVDAEARAAQKNQTPYVVFESTPERARALERQLFRAGKHTMYLPDDSGKALLHDVPLLQQAGLVTIASGGDSEIKRQLIPLLLPDTLVDLTAEPEKRDLLHNI